MAEAETTASGVVLEVFLVVFERPRSGPSAETPRFLPPEAPPVARTTLLRSTALALLARERPLSVREHGREDGLTIDARFDDPIAAVRAALAIRKRLLAEAVREEREP